MLILIDKKFFIGGGAGKPVAAPPFFKRRGYADRYCKPTKQEINQVCSDPDDHNPHMNPPAFPRAGIPFFLPCISPAKYLFTWILTILCTILRLIIMVAKQFSAYC
jgi:hypothetical protein